MSTDELKHYIQEKLAALKKEKDMNEVVTEGRLSFGLDQKDYKHLPSWNELLKEKKKLVRTFWINCFLISFVSVGFASTYADKFQQNWIKGLVTWLVVSLMATLFNVIGFYFSLFYRVRKTEQEVRKLMYEDILDKMNRTGAGAA
jgi:TM2 domain-containing membrane protein YozV